MGGAGAGVAMIPFILSGILVTVLAGLNLFVLGCVCLYILRRCLISTQDVQLMDDDYKVTSPGLLCSHHPWGANRQVGFFFVQAAIADIACRSLSLDERSIWRWWTGGNARRYGRRNGHGHGWRASSVDVNASFAETFDRMGGGMDPMMGGGG